jgi:hypothetical protein
MFFTFQSLFPEAAAGTATIPVPFSRLVALKHRVRQTHDSRSGKRWRALAENAASGKAIVRGVPDIDFHL